MAAISKIAHAVLKIAAARDCDCPIRRLCHLLSDNFMKPEGYLMLNFAL